MYWHKEKNYQQLTNIQQIKFVYAKIDLPKNPVSVQVTFSTTGERHSNNKQNNKNNNDINNNKYKNENNNKDKNEKNNNNKNNNTGILISARLNMKDRPDNYPEMIENYVTSARQRLHKLKISKTTCSTPSCNMFSTPEFNGYCLLCHEKRGCSPTTPVTTVHPPPLPPSRHSSPNPPSPPPNIPPPLPYRRVPPLTPSHPKDTTKADFTHSKDSTKVFSPHAKDSTKTNSPHSKAVNKSKSKSTFYVSCTDTEGNSQTDITLLPQQNMLRTRGIVGGGGGGGCGGGGGGGSWQYVQGKTSHPTESSSACDVDGLSLVLPIAECFQTIGTRCRAPGCKFYGSSVTQGYCSSCYRKTF